MREGMLHIRDVEGPKKTGSMETRLEAVEQQVFKCQGMVERGLNANHMMITKFTSKHRIDANDIGKHLSRLYDRIDQLQGQIYDLQNQNFGSTVAGGNTWRAKGACRAGALASGLVRLPSKESLSGTSLSSRQGGLAKALDVFPGRKACRGLERLPGKKGFRGLVA
ncbi:40S ribosomal protein S5-1 [Hordeum vulgare]|nr:40S ribosomal protein S5-1 [Hordeum vulgare]